MINDFFVSSQVRGLHDEHAPLLAAMLQQLQSKQSGNKQLEAYYNADVESRNLGIALPENMDIVQAALGWPKKAVQALARKHIFDGFALDGSPDPFGVDDLFTANNFNLELNMAINNAYKHSCSFITVAPGNPDMGEPDVVIQGRSALWTTGLWDQRLRRLSAALTITEVERQLGLGANSNDTSFTPKSAVMYLPDAIIALNKVGTAWVADYMPNRTGRVMVEMLAYDPALDTPFGRSRITPEVQYLTDAALRTLVRSEVSAEFFSAPQRYALGADEDAFDGKSGWEWVIGSLLNIPNNEDGETPQLGQFAQISMTPHLEMYRQLAQNFCSATNLPMSAVGLFADNPASAEAMQAAEYALSDEAEYQWEVFNPALRRIHQNVVMLRDNLTEPPADTWKVGVKHIPCRYVSPQAASDFIVKTVSAIPKIGDTTVALSRAGFTNEEIKQMQAEWARAGSGSIIDKILQTGYTTPDTPKVETNV